MRHDLATAEWEWWRPPQAAAPHVVVPPQTESGGLPFNALMAFTCILILSPQTWLPALAPLRIALMSAGLAIVAHVAEAYRSGRPLIRLDLPTLLALSLACWALVTVPMSVWPGGSLGLLLDVYFKALTVFWLLSSVVNTRRRLRRACWTFALLMLPLATTAVHHYVSGVFVEGLQAVDRIMGFEAPLTENPNDLALMLNLGLPLMVALLLTSRGFVVRAVLAASAVVAGFGVVVTFSRAGFLSLGSTVVGYLVKLWRRGHVGLLASVAAACLASLFFLPAGYLERLSTISNIEADKTRSAELRWVDMVESSRLLLDNPLLGAGIGMNVLALNEVRGKAWKQVHNAYLQYGVDLGLLGVLLFVGLLGACIRDVARVQRGCRDQPARRELFCLAEGLQMSLLAFAVAAMFQPVAYHFYFFYMGGLAVAARRIHEAETGA
jgi:O-antigen ligase